MEEKTHNIVKEPKSIYADANSPDNYFCTKCAKRWENLIIQQGEMINIYGCTAP